MIISASRRTDIPSFYSPWFFNRIKEGYVLVPNPFRPTQISRISLRPEVVDCIVFWTKNPGPMIDKLGLLKDYHYYFQFTLNPYDRDIENNLPPLSQRISLFRQLSDRIGKEKVIWRYDPLFVTKKYCISFHQENFARMAEALKNHTTRCMLGFLDPYPHIRKTMEKNDLRPLFREEMEEVALSFQKIIAHYPGIEINTCTHKVDLNHLGVPAGQCIDQTLIEQITGYPISASKDKNQRPACNCIESIDIGTYNSCLNGCLYCYANKGNTCKTAANRANHNPHSPLLIGQLKENQPLKDREVKSLRNKQLPLF